MAKKVYVLSFNNDGNRYVEYFDDKSKRDARFKELKADEAKPGSGITNVKKDTVISK